MSDNTHDETNAESEAESGESDREELGPNEHVVQLPDKQVITSPHDDPPDYSQVVVAENKPHVELNTYERRAVLLDRIEAEGHPRAISKTYAQLGDEFAVGKATIANDMSRLSEYVAENLDRDHHRIVDTVFRGALRDLVAEGESARAAEIAREWYGWLADMGEVERVADDVNLNISSDEVSTDAYEVVESEPAVDANDLPAESES